MGRTGERLLLPRDGWFMRRSLPERLSLDGSEWTWLTVSGSTVGARAGTSKGVSTALDAVFARGTGTGSARIPMA
jgi:hypothetical protein